MPLLDVAIPCASAPLLLIHKCDLQCKKAQRAALTPIATWPALGGKRYFASAAGLVVAVWMHARVTANARRAIMSAPMTSIHGLTGARRDLPGPETGCVAGLGIIDRSYMACPGPPIGSCGGLPQLA